MRQIRKTDGFLQSLTIDQSQLFKPLPGFQGVQAQFRVARCYGVMDALHVVFTGSPQVHHLTRAHAAQQARRGRGYQWNQWRWRQQQTLWNWNCPYKGKHTMKDVDVDVWIE